MRRLRDAAQLFFDGDDDGGDDDARRLEPAQMLPEVERYLDKEAPYTRAELCALLGVSEAQFAKHALWENVANSRCSTL